MIDVRTAGEQVAVHGSSSSPMRSIAPSDARSPYTETARTDSSLPFLLRVPIGESTSGDKHPSRRNPGDDLGQGLEAGGEALDEDWQVDDEEVGGRWFTVLPSIGTELPVKVLEERLGDAYDPPVSRHHCVERPSRAPRAKPSLSLGPAPRTPAPADRGR